MTFNSFNNYRDDQEILKIPNQEYGKNFSLLISHYFRSIHKQFTLLILLLIFCFLNFIPLVAPIDDLPLSSPKAIASPGVFHSVLLCILLSIPAIIPLILDARNIISRFYELNSGDNNIGTLSMKKKEFMFDLQELISSIMLISIFFLPNLSIYILIKYSSWEKLISVTNNGCTYMKSELVWPHYLAQVQKAIFTSQLVSSLACFLGKLFFRKYKINLVIFPKLSPILNGEISFNRIFQPWSIENLTFLLIILTTIGKLINLVQGTLSGNKSNVLYCISQIFYMVSFFQLFLICISLIMQLKKTTQNWKFVSDIAMSDFWHIITLILFFAACLVILIGFFHFPRFKYYRPDPMGLEIWNYLQASIIIILIVIPGRCYRLLAKQKEQKLETRLNLIRYVSHEMRTPLNTLHLGLMVITNELTGMHDHLTIQNQNFNECLCPTVYHTNASKDKQKPAKHTQLSEKAQNLYPFQKSLTEGCFQPFNSPHMEKKLHFPCNCFENFLSLKSKLSEDAISDLISTSNQLNESCKVAISTLDDLLTFDKLDEKKIVIELEDINPWAFISQSSKPFEINARQAKVNFDLSCSPYPNNRKNQNRSWVNKFVIKADKFKLSQVLRNLISNALKFTPINGTVNINLELISSSKTLGKGIKPFEYSVYSKNEKAPSFSSDSSNENIACGQSQNFSLDQSNKTVVDARFKDENSNKNSSEKGRRKYLRITISDTGPGIAKENQKYLFGQYVQFNPGQLQQGKGSGLGLWISKSIVEMHQGNIGVNSEGLGKGSTFYVELPLYSKRKKELNKEIKISKELTASNPDFSEFFCEDITPPPAYLDEISETPVRVPAEPKEAYHLVLSGVHLNRHESTFINCLSEKDISKPGSRENEDITSPKYDSEVQENSSNDHKQNETENIKEDELEEIEDTNIYEDLSPFSNFTVSPTRRYESIGNIRRMSSSFDSNFSASHLSIATKLSINFLNNPVTVVWDRSHSKSISNDDEDGVDRRSAKPEIANHQTIDEPISSKNNELALLFESDQQDIESGGNSPKFASSPNEEDKTRSVSLLNVTKKALSSISSFYSNSFTGRIFPSDESIKNTESNANFNDSSRTLHKKSSDSRQSSNLNRENSITVVHPSPLKERAKREPSRSAHNKLNYDDEKTVKLLPTRRIPSNNHESLIQSNINTHSNWDKGLKILIVDDATSNRKIVGKLLHSFGHSVFEASNGKECIDKVKNSVISNSLEKRIGHDIDLILMDDQMPELSGPKTTEILRSIDVGFNGLIYGVTGNVGKVEIDQFLSHGADEVLSKPLDIEVLKSYISKDLKTN